MSTIRIKRSGTGGNPAVLAQGELAYSFLADGGYLFNGGDRLYIGTGNEVNGNAANHTTIGGKFFTDMLDHSKGVLTASSAVVTDAANKIDILNISNLTIGSAAGGGEYNTIQATNLDGNIILRPDGLGYVQIDTHGQLIIPVGTIGQRGTGHQGAIRFNTDQTTFEGYNGTNWASLGGVRSVDGNAYIIAETSPGAGDDTLHFYAGTSGIPGTSVSVADWSTTTLTVKTILTATTANRDINLGASTGTGVTTINSGALGSLDHITIGGTTPAAGTFTSVTDTGLTATRVTFASTGGLLSGSANLTYASGTFTIADATASTDATHGALVVTGGVGIGGDLRVTGNITGASNGSAQFFGDQYGFNALYAGYNTFTQLPNTSLQVTAYKNDYAQINFQNYSNGNIASADYVATADNGSNYTGFIDMGIASGTYDSSQTGVLGPVVTANDGYLYVTGDTTTNVNGIPGVGVGNLVIGTTSENSQVKIVVASGTTSTHPSVVFNPYNTAATDTASGTLIVTGGVGISGDLHVGNLVLANNSVSTTSGTGSVTLNASGGYAWTFGTDGTTAFPNYTFPSAHGTVGQVLVDNGSGALAWAQPASSFNVDAQSGGPQVFDLLTDTLSTVSGNTNITTSVAQSNFRVTTTVSLASTLTNLVEVDVGNLVLANNSVSATGGTGSVTINASGGYAWSFNTDGTTSFPNDTLETSSNNDFLIKTNGKTWTFGQSDGSLKSTMFKAAQGTAFNGSSGYTFYSDSQFDTGMFSTADGYVQLAANGQNIAQYSASPTQDAKWVFAKPVTFGSSVAGTGGYTLPTADGSNQYALTTNGSGAVSWTAVVNSVSGGANLNTTSNATTGDVTVNLDTTLIGLVAIDVGSLVISNNEIAGQSGIGDVVIETSDGAVNYTWTFGTDGNTSFAGQIKNINDPTDPQDAATKYYVDHVAAGLHIHEPAMAATTDTLTAITGGTVTYNNGVSGVGATLTLSTPMTILDNYSLHNGDRVLVKNETDLFTNGIYSWAIGGTVLTRVADFNNIVEVGGGDFLFIQEGTQYGSTGWVQTNTTTAIGVSDITFSQFSGQGTFLAGDGMTLNGNVFSVNLETNSGLTLNTHKLQVASSIAGNGLTYTDGVINVVGTSNRISVSSNSIDIASTYIGQNSITTVGTVTTGTWNGNTVAAAYGGTGHTTYTRSDLLIGNTSGGLSILGIGGPGQVLRVNAAGTDIEYADLDGGVY